jgi:hypothetical protein
MTPVQFGMGYIGTGRVPAGDTITSGTIAGQ